MEEPTPLQQHPGTPKIPAEPLPPIQSRFLFVDVAALRAKQLRRAALQPRLGEEVRAPHKPERVAMEEVKARTVYDDVPPAKSARRGRRMNADAIQIAIGTLQGVLSSTGFRALSLHRFSASSPGFAKTRKTVTGGRAAVIKSLDERISHQPMVPISRPASGARRSISCTRRNCSRPPLA